MEHTCTTAFPAQKYTWLQPQLSPCQVCAVQASRCRGGGSGQCPVCRDIKQMHQGLAMGRVWGECGRLGWLRRDERSGFHLPVGVLRWEED